MVSLALLEKKAWEGKGSFPAPSPFSFLLLIYPSIGGEDFLAERKWVGEKIGRLRFIRSDHFSGRIEFLQRWK